MTLIKFLSMLLTLGIIAMLAIYFFLPFNFNTTEFLIKKPAHTNFSLNNSSLQDMQFYKNLIYPTKQISYKISACHLQKEGPIERAFDIIENKTILDFRSVTTNEDISVRCDSKIKSEERFFIAGEGGPTNITITDNFNVILHGSVLLLRESKCSEPNIGLHEIFHALGFDHSSNPRNIMYNLSKCDQEISKDMINLIEEIYSYPSYADLAFQNVSAKMSGRFLDLNLTVKNNGLKKSENSIIKIYADEKLIEELDLEPMEIGTGRIVRLQNLLVTKISINELKLIIEYTHNELDKLNNEIVLEIKN